MALALVTAVALAACSDDDGDNKTSPDQQVSSPDLGVDSAAPDLRALEASVPDQGKDSAGSDTKAVDLTLVDAGTPDGASLTLLSNETPCKGTKAAIIPDAKEFGHLFAARLTPASYPFTVTNIRYMLSKGTDKCSPTIAHRVELYVSSKTAPEASPTIAATIKVPTATITASSRLVALKLATPVKLQNGEHLYIAVEMASGTGGKAVCMDVCDNNGIKDRNYWSNATKAPYKWATLDSFGMKVNAMIEALGY